MPPIEIGPGGTHAPRGVMPVDVSPVKNRQVASDTVRGQTPNKTPVVRSEALNPGIQPLNNERVALIRKAIEEDRYPVLPVKVSDEMIAAGYLLRSKK